MRLTPYQRIMEDIRCLSRLILVLALIDLAIIILIVGIVIPNLAGQK